MSRMSIHAPNRTIVDMHCVFMSMVDVGYDDSRTPLGRVSALNSGKVRVQGVGSTAKECVHNVREFLHAIKNETRADAVL